MVLEVAGRVQSEAHTAEHFRVKAVVGRVLDREQQQISLARLDELYPFERCRGVLAFERQIGMTLVE